MNVELPKEYIFTSSTLSTLSESPMIGKILDTLEVEKEEYNNIKNTLDRIKKEGEGTNRILIDIGDWVLPGLAVSLQFEKKE